MGDEVLKDILSDAFEDVGDVLGEELKRALDGLTAVSEQAVKDGISIASKIADVAQKTSEGKIDHSSANLALTNYIESLKLIGLSVVNKEAAESYKAAMRILGRIKNIALAAAKVAADLYVPQFSSILKGLVV